MLLTVSFQANQKIMFIELAGLDAPLKIGTAISFSAFSELKCFRRIEKLVKKPLKVVKHTLCPEVSKNYKYTQEILAAQKKSVAQKSRKAP